MKKGEPIIKGKEALADAYADCYSDKPLDRWQALHDGYFQGYKDAEKDLGWISVKDRLPDTTEYVFTCIEQNGIPQCVGFHYYKDGKWWEGFEEDTVGAVEYWMPIPKLPEKWMEGNCG